VDVDWARLSLNGQRLLTGLSRVAPNTQSNADYSTRNAIYSAARRRWGCYNCGGVHGLQLLTPADELC